jgi:hypothetical protein
MITRQKMNAVAVESALRKIQFEKILNQIEARAKLGEFSLVVGIGDDLIERLKAEPYGFTVTVDHENPSEPSVIYWN